MRPSTIGELLAKRSGAHAVGPATTAAVDRVACPWWMDPAGLSRKCAPGGREATGRVPERVPPDP
jgi:hypothetical protein